MLVACFRITPHFRRRNVEEAPVDNIDDTAEDVADTAAAVSTTIIFLGMDCVSFEPRLGIGAHRLDLTAMHAELQGDEEEELLFSDLHAQRELDARDESEGLKGGNSTKVRRD